MIEENKQPEKGSLRELAGVESEEEAITKVKAGLKRIESVHDLADLPLTLIQDVYHNANIIEKRGTTESLRFSSDSKRRLLDSLIKGKTLISTVPISCESCPRNENRISDKNKRRIKLAELFDAAQLTPKQWRRMGELMPHPYIKYKP